MELSVGTAIGPYSIRRLIGRGGMAAVYLAMDRDRGVPCAIKVVSGGGRSFASRLRREGRVQRRLRHRNIVTVTDVIDVHGAPALVMEYIAGPTLAQLLAIDRPTLEEADALARDIIDGVSLAHAAGLVHRDLKPSNVLLSIEGGQLVPKVADFGLAKVLRGREAGHHQTRSGQAMGTPNYMAPEQVRDASRVDARADIFALGCMLYELVAGRVPFAGRDAFEVYEAVVRGVRDDVRSHAPGIPDAMARAIDGALEVDLDARTTTVEAVRRAWVGKRDPEEVDWTRLVELCRPLVHVPDAPPPATWIDERSGDHRGVPAPPVARWPLVVAVVGILVLLGVALALG